MIEQLCRSVYSETASLYDHLVPKMGERALGYKILYGPPKVRAPILFLGYQPGGSKCDARKGELDGERVGWPQECEYATAKWLLAQKMREIWGAELLAECVGLNLIFFRARSIKEWKRVPLDVLAEAKAHSREKAALLVGALQPQKIVVIGLGAFDLMTKTFGATSRSIVRPAERDLIRGADLCGIPSLGTIHLTGARLSSDERRAICTYFKGGRSDRSPD